MSDIARWGAGVVLAVAIALAAWRGGALAATGAAAAAILGTIAVGAGWDWAILLVVYFLTSSALSRIGARERDARTLGRIEKGGPRDAVQVLANGGVFGVAAIAFAVSGDRIWWSVGGAALAASAADTWATEIGTLARAAPRSIISGQVVPPGTSGGVTAQGVMAAVAGAALVAGMASFFGWPRAAVNAAMFGGVFGSLLDSLLGATVQARRWCERCDTATEQRLHGCGHATALRGGLSWLDNDGVNLASTVGGALVGAVMGAIA